MTGLMGQGWMSCRQVGRNLADLIDGALSTPLRDQVEEHLRRCAPCAAQRDAAKLMASTIALSGAVTPGAAVTGTGFEQRVLTAVRGRRAAPRPTDDVLAPFRAPGWPAFPIFRRPAPLQAAAAAAIMLFAGVVAVLYGGITASREPAPTMATLSREAAAWDDETADAWSRTGPALTLDDALSFDQSDRDMLMPAREVPFTLRQDLVGFRSGRIPATTYVLEPAPDESAVMRASF